MTMNMSTLKTADPESWTNLLQSDSALWYTVSSIIAWNRKNIYCHSFHPLKVLSREKYSGSKVMFIDG